jgi:Uma2 family endonuclease
VLAPDTSFIVRERMPTLPSHGFAPLAPDLAVEVRSPRDSWTYVLQRGGIWIAHGVRVVWLIDAVRRRAVTMRPLGEPEEIGGGGVLSGAPVLPGLTLGLDDLCEGILCEGMAQEP